MGEQTLTYGDFAARSSSYSLGLQALGVVTSDRVMMYAENCIEHLLMYHAVARLGAIFTPVHPEFRSRELEYAVGNSTPKVIITNDSLVGDVTKSLQVNGLSATILLVGDRSSELHSSFYPSIETLPRCGESPPVIVDPDAPILISYTSGTSSLPKPVLRSHGAEAWSARAYAKAWGFEPEDSVLVAMSLSWVYGLCSLAQTALSTGATVVLDRKFSPTRSLELMQAGRVTAFAGTTSMYSMMLNVLADNDFKVAGVSKLFLGGEPRNEAVIERVENFFGLRLCEGWAMTETFPALAIHPVLDVSAPVGSLGRPVDGVEIRLVDDVGADVDDGKAGEAWIRSPGNFLGYLNESELTKERRTEDGWVRSGDIVAKDQDGYYTFLSRKSELIIRGGVNISPAEIESALGTHPSISDSIVFGVPDPVLGESVCAFVIWRDGAAPDSLADLQFYLEARVAKFKIPSVLFNVDDIPRSTTGKKNRSKAREIAINLQQAAQLAVV